VQGIYPVDSSSVSEAEPFFAWAEARTVLWGGLIVTFPVPAHPAPSEGRSSYLRSLVAARTGFAREFLAYGRMQRPPDITCGALTIDHGLAAAGWLRRIRFPRENLAPQVRVSKREQNETHSKELSVEQWASGLVSIPFATPRIATLSVPSVLSQAYTLGDDRLGVLLVNLRRDTAEVVRLRVDPAAYGLPSGAYAISSDRVAEHRSLGVISTPHKAELRLVPRDVVLVTAKRVGN
jgi:hypothetical protein